MVFGGWFKLFSCHLPGNWLALPADPSSVPWQAHQNVFTHAFRHHSRRACSPTSLHEAASLHPNILHSTTAQNSQQLSTYIGDCVILAPFSCMVVHQLLAFCCAFVTPSSCMLQV
jgi:hypothetical protein